MLVGEIFAYALLILKKAFSPIFSLFLLGIMGLDWFIQFVKIAPSTNFRRFVTGICGGLGSVFLCFHFALNTVKALRACIKKN